MEQHNNHTLTFKKNHKELWLWEKLKCEGSLQKGILWPTRLWVGHQADLTCKNIVFKPHDKPQITERNIV